MIQLNFENYINEKLGIRDDVIILSDFLYDYLKNIKNVNSITIKGEDLPELSFKVSYINIEFKKYDYMGSFDFKRTKLTKNGVCIYLIFNKKYEIRKSTIYHEVSHLIEHEIKLSKRIDDFKNLILSSKISNIFSNKKFNNLCQLIYYSDDSEINSLTHEFYCLLKDEFYNFTEYDKNDVFKHIIDSCNIKNIYNEMINYNIFEDLKDISENIKLSFFKKLINMDKNMIKIMKNKNNKFFIIMRILLYIIKGYENKLSLNEIMYKTQKHINTKGIKLRNNIHRIYGLI